MMNSNKHLLVKIMSTALISAAVSSVSATTFSPLFEDAYIAVRNVTKYENIERWDGLKEDTEYGGFDDQLVAASATGINFRSGLAGNNTMRAGFNMGAVNVLDLGSSTYDKNYTDYEGVLNQKCNILYEEAGKIECYGSEGYSRITVADLKFQFGDNFKEQTRVRIGLGPYKGGLVKPADPDKSIVPNSYLGANVTKRMDDIFMDAVFVSKYISNGMNKPMSVTVAPNYADRFAYGREKFVVPFVYGFGVNKRGVDHLLSFKMGGMKGYSNRFTFLGRKSLMLEQSRIEFQSAFQFLNYGGDVWDEIVEKNLQDEDENDSRFVDLSLAYVRDNLRIQVAANAAFGSTNFSYGFNGVNGEIVDSTKDLMSFRAPGDRGYSIKTTYKYYPSFMSGEIAPFYNVALFTRSDIEQTAVNDNGYGYGIGFEDAKAIEQTVGVTYKQNQGYFKGLQLTMKGNFYTADKEMHGQTYSDPSKFDRTRLSIELKLPIWKNKKAPQF